MNLLLLDPSEFLEDGTAELRGGAARHVHQVLRAKAGDVLRVGKLGGAVGSAEVLRCEPEAVLLRVTLESPPPLRPGVDVLLALPRPKALRRLLSSAAALGVDRLVLLNAARVEKSYFSSPLLTPARTRRALQDGLEQARDTQAPKVDIAERFRPFVEDSLDGFLGPSTRFLLDPSEEARAPEVALASRVALAIGPEGGWVPFERDLLQTQGFVPVSFGPRTLKVEAVLPYALGWLHGIRSQGTRHGKVSPSVALP